MCPQIKSTYCQALFPSPVPQDQIPKKSQIQKSNWDWSWHLNHMSQQPTHHLTFILEGLSGTWELMVQLYAQKLSVGELCHDPRQSLWKGEQRDKWLEVVLRD